MDEESFELDPADIEIPEMREDTGVPGAEFNLKRIRAQAGDTIKSVADREKVDPLQLSLINGLGPRDHIAKGRELIVPIGRGMVHLVAARESVSSLARRYNLRDATILFFNRTKHDDLTLRSGEKLFIPVGAIAPEVTRQVATNEAIKRLIENKLALAWPVPYGRITSCFGYRTDPFLLTTRFHKGVDIACSWGTAVRAAERGRVVWAGWRGAAGIAIIIEHPTGLYSIYGHCSKVLVKRGDWVSRRQPVGRVGSTGRSTGSHLHFTLKREGQVINPLRYLSRAGLPRPPRSRG
jgi:murein DD-endopeptidase MepM/ murein hydrolase activator NlpD